MSCDSRKQRSAASSPLSIASLFSPASAALYSSSLSSVTIYPLSHFISPSDAQTLSAHFIFLQPSLPFLLFLACRSSRCHQVFCRRGGTCVRQEVTDDTNANVPFPMVTSGWRGRMEEHFSAAYLSATQVMTRLIDAATVRDGIPRMPAIPRDVARAACARKHLQEVE